MSRDASISLTWGDGDFKFRLGWGELEELQEKTDAGPYVVLRRILDGSWRVQDISNVIRLGLIGGGMSPTDAIQKVRAYVERRPPMENVIHARAILSVALVGTADEKLGEQEAPDLVEDQSMTSQMEKSDTAPSTEPEPL